MDISVIIPVYNEHSVPALKTCHGVEIIIVDGSPYGSTIRKIKDTNVITLVSLPGRANQMNAGAKQAKGDILLFLHADTKLPKNAIHLIMTALKNPTYVGGAFDLDIDSKRLTLKIIAYVASLRSRMTKIPYGDQAFFIRKDVFNRLKGYRDIPIMEDVDFMQRLKNKKFKIKILRQKVITSARRWELEGIFYTTIRNWLLIFLFNIGVSPEKLKRFYI